MKPIQKIFVTVNNIFSPLSLCFGVSDFSETFSAVSKCSKLAKSVFKVVSKVVKG